MNESCHTTTLMNESCHTHERVMPHSWMSHTTRMSHVTLINESCHTHTNTIIPREHHKKQSSPPRTNTTWLMSHARTSHVTLIESHTHERVMSHVVMSHATLIWTSHVTYKRVMPHTWKFMSQPYEYEYCERSCVVVCVAVMCCSVCCSHVLSPHI